ncbi:MAG: hypothetical protein ACUVTZ_05940 [Armatimonadota bacterium]
MIPKLDLLPEWFREGKRVRNTWILMVLAWLVVLGGMIGYGRQLSARIAMLDEEIAAIRPDAELKDKLEQEAGQIQSSIKPITDKVTYIKAIHEYNRKFPSLFEETNRYTYYRVGYRSLQPAMTVLNMNAYCRSVSDIGRYLLNMQLAKGLFTAISITGGIPGGSAGGQTPAGEGTPVTMPMSNPYSAYMSGAPGAPGGMSYGAPSPMTSSPYATASTVMGDSTTTTAVALLEFQAVAQLAQKWVFTTPTYAGAPAAAEGTGQGAYGPYGAPPGVYPYSGGPPGGPSGPMNGGAPANAGAADTSAGGGEETGGLGRRGGLGGGE